MAVWVSKITIDDKKIPVRFEDYQVGFVFSRSEDYLMVSFIILAKDKQYIGGIARAMNCEVLGVQSLRDRYIKVEVRSIRWRCSICSISFKPWLMANCKTICKHCKKSEIATFIRLLKKEGKLKKTRDKPKFTE